DALSRLALQQLLYLRHHLGKRPLAHNQEAVPLRLYGRIWRVSSSTPGNIQDFGFGEWWNMVLFGAQAPSGQDFLIIRAFPRESRAIAPKIIVTAAFRDFFCCGGSRTCGSWCRCWCLLGHLL